MKRSQLLSLVLATCVLSGVLTVAVARDDDDDKAPDAKDAPQLNSEQQRAVGIVVAHPIAAKMPARLDALATILDPTSLLSDMGDATAAAAAEKAAAAELGRLRELYQGGTSASLKLLEAAEAEHARLQVQTELAAGRFTLHWQPIAALPVSERLKLVDALAKGALLARVDLLGRHSIGILPRETLLDVDGVEVKGLVLGLVKQTTELQSVGLLVEVARAPAGLGPGARVPAVLLSEGRAGLLLPRAAVLYDENGAYVYKQLTAKPDERAARYVAVRVSLLAPYGDGWMTEGLDDDDNIVVHGAGVLWSLQGVGTHAVADEDED